MPPAGGLGFGPDPVLLTLAQHPGRVPARLPGLCECGGGSSTTGGPDPELLLAELKRIEGEFGRRPKIVLNEPRPLDLDLIAWGREVRQSAALTLPHPRAHLRHFVLCPLAELAPDLVLPGQRQTVRQLLAALGPAPDLVQLAGSAIS